MTGQALLEVDGLTVDYPIGAGGHFRAVDGVSLRVRPGETVGLVGESGSGKTTLGRAIVGLVPPSAGRIVFAGEDITRVGRKRHRQLAAHRQMVFQDPLTSLNPARTIGQTLAEPLLSLPRRERPGRAEHIAEMLLRVGLPADISRRYPGQLSGGQRQRVAIARALMLRPRLVVCDEPVSALDLSVQAQILNLLADLQDELRLSYLFVAHNLSVVRHLATSVVVLYRGRVMEAGPAERVYSVPAHPYTRALLTAAPTADPEAQRHARERRAVLARPATSNLGPHTGCAFAHRCSFVTPACLDQPPPLVEIAQEQFVACVRRDVIGAASLTDALPATR